ncbi:MAG TPA: putative lipid II flippase FtsW [Mycobacteriales bacterium]|nr:putative lipid II flippase FtsW [Mycobacteriales bacterium]
MTSVPLPDRSSRARRSPRPAGGEPAAPRATRLAAVPAPKARLLDRPLASYYLVVGTTGVLVLLGLVMVLSASSVSSYQSSGNSYALFERQLLWVGLGLPLAVAASKIPIRFARLLAYPLLLASAGGLLLVLVPGVGVSAYGATRWIGAGSFTIQPSELAKLALALWGADLLVRKHRRLGEWRHLLIPLLPVGALFAALVMVEPDMGTTIVLLLVVLALLWVVGAPARLFGTVAGVLAGLGGMLAILEPYRLARLTSFVHPFADAQGNGYQAVQGIYALASGGWWGNGLGASHEKWDYLPNAHTDFIFAIIGEELGLLGTFLVLALFGVLGYAGIRVAQRSRDPFVRLASAAITAWLIGQALVNVGAVVGVLPITGIPLPLISFGGSALVPTLVAIGLLAGFARAERSAAGTTRPRPATGRRPSAGASPPAARVRRRPAGGKRAAR